MLPPRRPGGDFARHRPDGAASDDHATVAFSPSSSIKVVFAESSVDAAPAIAWDAAVIVVPSLMNAVALVPEVSFRKSPMATSVVPSTSASVQPAYANQPHEAIATASLAITSIRVGVEVAAAITCGLVAGFPE